jgi:broad specificity phosphatase PhoE
MNIILIRHAESEFNVAYESYLKHQAVYPNLPDAEITLNGVKQAKDLGDQLVVILGECKRVYFIVSPLKRAQKTFLYVSQALDKHKIAYKHETNELCREYKTDSCDFFDNEPFEIEEEDLFEKRLSDFRDYLTKIKSDHDIILVISHSDFIYYLLNSDPINKTVKWLDNCCWANMVT